jgi:ketol-acid reductoisomerase
MAAFSTGGVQEMDSHVNAGIDLDVVMAIALGLVEDNSKAAAAADSDGLTRIDSVVARQDVVMVVSPDVTVETARPSMYKY